MKAAVLYGKHDMRIEDIPIPNAKDGYKLVKVAYCGICGTDVHLFEGDEGSVKLVPGTVPGHELSGYLEETGELVTVDPNYFCGICDECLAGRTHYCLNITNTGVTENGGFAEYVLAHESQIYKIPNGVSPIDAAFAEPISCCLHGADLTALEKTDRVLITGAGTIGLIMAQLCRAAGVSHIAVSEPLEMKRKRALSLGADSVFDSTSMTIDKLRKCGFNKVIECSGNINAVKTALACCKNTGTVMLFGLTKPDDIFEIKPFDLFKRELTIKASYINPGTISRAVEMLTSGAVNPSNLVSEIISLRELPLYLKDSKNKLANGKVMVKL
ncbi:MAG: zinc-dependent alcohol dehydrogenase family protein [Clostridia bacterium]|nr:zinc-dependent alcohol dehydrogenase family protein [Clostridia bacterium]